MHLIIDWISSQVGEAKTILDIGCNTGWYGGFFKIYSTSDRYVVGCDLDVTGLRAAKRLLDGAVHADVRNLPFRGKIFEAGLCVEVIEHLAREDGTRLVAESLRVCKRLLLTTPNGWRGEGCKRAVDTNPLMRHQSYYTKRDLTRLGARKVRGIGFRFGNPPGSHQPSTNSEKSRSKILYNLVFWILPYVVPSLADNLMAEFDGKDLTKELHSELNHFSHSHS